MDQIQSIINQYEETVSSYVPVMYDFMLRHMHIMPITAVILYLLMVFGLPPLLKSKDASKPRPPGKFLKFAMISWNLLLSIFSAALCIFSSIPFARVVFQRGPRATICDTHHDLFNPSGMLFWGFLFIFSKYAELFDTLFLIVKNPERKVPFLHWFHHTTVLVFSWYATLSKYTVGFWFGSINAAVHTLMYFYYFLTELGYRPTWAKPLTMFQISQMVAGIVLNGIWAYDWFSGKKCECDNPEAIMTACLLMYASYLFLFVRFFVQRYWGSSKKTTPQQQKKNQ